MCYTNWQNKIGETNGTDWAAVAISLTLFLPPSLSLCLGFSPQRSPCLCHIHTHTYVRHAPPSGSTTHITHTPHGSHASRSSALYSTHTRSHSLSLYLYFTQTRTHTHTSHNLYDKLPTERIDNTTSRREQPILIYCVIDKSTTCLFTHSLTHSPARWGRQSICQSVTQWVTHLASHSCPAGTCKDNGETCTQRETESYLQLAENVLPSSCLSWVVFKSIQAVFM